MRVNHSQMSLFLVTAMPARARGPCWPKWYPNLTILELFSSMVAISISTESPSFCLCDKNGKGDNTKWWIKLCNVNCSTEVFLSWCTLKIFSEDDHLSAVLTYLVVDLYFGKRGIGSQGLDDGHHAFIGDEVGFDVKTYQVLICLKHISYRLEKRKSGRGNLLTRAVLDKQYMTSLGYMPISVHFYQ